MTEHLDVDALADLLAGEGDAAATDHVASCARCGAALTDLDAALVPVAAELAALAASPLPPVPEDLEQTLLARLRTEPAPVAGAPATLPPTLGPGVPLDTVTEVPEGARAVVGDVLPGGVVPLQPRTSRRAPSHRTTRRSPAVLGVAAGVVGLLAVAGLGLGLSGGLGSGLGSSSSDASGSDAGGSAAAAPLADLPVRASGTDYGPEADVFARALPGLLAPGTTELQAQDAAPEAAARTSDDVGTVAGGTGGSVGAESGGTTGGGASSGTSSGGTSGTAADSGAGSAAQAAPLDPLARLRDPAELAGCLAEVSGPDSDGVPLALDYATYQGQPALVVVLPSAREGKVDVFAVGAGCRQGDDQTLYFARLDRP